MAAALSSPSVQQPTFRKLEAKLRIPPFLRPVLRAYVLGYASSTGPRLLSLIVKHWNRNRKRVRIIESEEEQSKNVFFHSFMAILRGGLELQRFPTSCAVLVGGSTLLQIPIRKLVERFMRELSNVAKTRLSRCISTFISAYLSLALLQSKQTPEFTAHIDEESYTKTTGKPTRPTRYAGRTLDLTLFAVTRALDVLIGSLWQTHTNPNHKLTKRIAYLTDPLIFSFSSFLIMWSFFYYPTRLPRSYSNWINTAASIDPRLILALRYSHQGQLSYGQSYPPNSPGLILQEMCKDYDWPIEWGDPNKTIPFPCEMVHMNDGSNCEYHALSRFIRSFKWALECNLPLNLILRLSNPSKRGFRRAVLSSVRSSAFLAGFISLFYYGVCLARTRSQQFAFTRELWKLLLGIRKKQKHPDFGRIMENGDASSISTPPSLLDRNQIIIPQTIPLNPHIQLSQAIDSGICIASGCLLCGWSILLESAYGTRRSELSLFCAPRALRTLFERRYVVDREWIERCVFAGCVVVVWEGVVGGKGKGLKVPRGVFGRVVGGVLN